MNRLCSNSRGGPAYVALASLGVMFFALVVNAYAGKDRPASDASTGAVGGAAIGASMGAIVGGISGDAGRGAAIGAASGGLLGARRRGNRRQEQANWERQQAAQRQDESQQLQAQFDAGMANYERAFTVCMRARDYEAL